MLFLKQSHILLTLQHYAHPCHVLHVTLLCQGFFVKSPSFMQYSTPVHDSNSRGSVYAINTFPQTFLLIQHNHCTNIHAKCEQKETRNPDPWSKRGRMRRPCDGINRSLNCLLQNANSADVSPDLWLQPNNCSPKKTADFASFLPEQCFIECIFIT